MKKLSIFLLLIFHLITSNAQDAIVRKLQQESLRQVEKKDISSDTSKINWKTGAVFSLGIGQGSQSHWAGGGDDFS